LLGHARRARPCARIPTSSGWAGSRFGLLLPDSARRRGPVLSAGHPDHRGSCHPYGRADDRRGAWAGLIKKMFAPQSVSPRFQREFPMGLALRPSQVKAFFEDTSHMVNAAGKLSAGYRALRCPIVIMAGDADGIVDVDRQARR